MKVRIEIPHEHAHDKDTRTMFIDDVLLWCMETEMDASFYTTIAEREDGKWGRVKSWWAVFTVETEATFYFTLKWGALMHKNQSKEATC